MNTQTARVQRTYRALVAAAGMVTAIRVILSCAHGLDVYSDSARYRAINSQPPLQTVDSALHILVSLVNLLPGFWTVAIQSAVAGLAWGFAGLVAAGDCRTRWRSIAGFTAVIGFSLLPWIQVWDTAALTESFTLSGCVLVVAGAYLCTATTTTSPITDRFASAGIAALWSGSILAMCSNAIVVLYVLPLALGVWLFARFLRKRGTSRSPRLASGWWALGVLALGIMCFITMIAQSVSIDWWYAQNRLAARGTPAYIQVAESDGMPACPQLMQLLDSSPPDLARVDQLRQMDCPGLSQWFQSGGLSPWTQLRTMPIETADNYIADIHDQWAPPWTGDGWSILGQQDNAWFINWYRAVPQILLAINLLAMALMACLAWLDRAATSRRLALNAPSLVYLWMLALTACYCVATWLQDPMEISRHALPATSMLTVGALIAVSHRVTSYQANREDQFP